MAAVGAVFNKVGRRADNLVVRFQHGAEEGCERASRATGDEHVLRIQCDLLLGSQLTGKLGAKRGDAGIGNVAEPQGAHSYGRQRAQRVRRSCGWRHVRIAKAEVANALRAQPLFELDAGLEHAAYPGGVGHLAAYADIHDLIHAFTLLCTNQTASYRTRNSKLRMNNRRNQWRKSPLPFEVSGPIFCGAPLTRPSASGSPGSRLWGA